MVKDFLEALNRVGVLANDRNRRIELTFYSDKVGLKAESSEEGFSAEEVECTFEHFGDSNNSEKSNDLKIAFNTKYLMDFYCLHGTRNEDQKVIWKFGEDNSQVLLMFEGEEKIFSYVIVPLKT